MGDAEARGYRGLRTWQKANELALAVFAAFGRSHTVPDWLVSQVCRSAVSVPANIAEGYSRGSIGDYVRFLEIARGSLGETEYYLAFLRDSGLVVPSQIEALESIRQEAGSLLFSLIRSVSAKQKEGTWDRHEAMREEREVYLADPFRGAG